MSDWGLPICIFFAMVFCHIIDDFYLQGILASMKQKKWWQPVPLYKHDYKIALFLHGFSWSFMINLPIAIYILCTRPMALILLPISYVFNMIIHALVDNIKANEYSISLVQDQLCHIVQIIVTWIVFFMVML